MRKMSFRAETAAGPVLIAVAVAGTVLSFMGIFRLALHVGWTPYAAWLLPVALDGMVVAGILQVLQATAAATSRRYGWWLTAGGALVSVAANALTATPAILAAVDQNVLAAVTHSLPVLAVVATLEAWLYMRRSSIHKAAQDAATVAREDQLSAELDASQANVAAGLAVTDQLRNQIAKLEGQVATADAGAIPPASTPQSTAKPLTAVPDLASIAGDKKARAAHVLELRAAGKTIPGISAATGCSVSTIKRILSAATTSAA